jgi:putative transposase
MSKAITRSRTPSPAPVCPELPQAAPSFLELIRRGAQSILQQAIEEEITEYLGRARYQHTSICAQPQHPGAYRNGTRQTRVDTPTGTLTYERPRLSGAPDFQSQYHTPYFHRPEEFNQAVAEMYVEGVSTRKVKKALQAIAGKNLRMSRSTVSRITKRLRDEFLAWKKRDLSDLKVAYLFVDAIRIGMRLENTRKQAVLVAYAVLEDGTFETLSIGLGNEESKNIWGHFVGDLKLRGLKDPLLAISDGNAGVIAALDAHFPTAYRQRCTKHKIDNVLDAIPKEKHDEVRPKLNRIFYGATSLEQAKAALDVFRRQYRKIYPTAVGRLENDLDQCLTFFLFPAAHWRRIRTSNKLERMNLEIRRRLNVIGRHPSEDGCLALVYQITKRYAARQKAFGCGDLVQALWRRLRKEKVEMVTQLQFELVRSAA